MAELEDDVPEELFWWSADTNPIKVGDEIKINGFAFEVTCRQPAKNMPNVVEIYVRRKAKPG